MKARSKRNKQCYSCACIQIESLFSCQSAGFVLAKWDFCEAQTMLFFVVLLFFFVFSAWIHLVFWWLTICLPVSESWSKAEVCYRDLSKLKANGMRYSHVLCSFHSFAKQCMCENILSKWSFSQWYWSSMYTSGCAINDDHPVNSVSRKIWLIDWLICQMCF